MGVNIASRTNRTVCSSRTELQHVHSRRPLVQPPHKLLDCARVANSCRRRTVIIRAQSRSENPPSNGQPSASHFRLQGEHLQRSLERLNKRRSDYEQGKTDALKSDSKLRRPLQD
eukprot:5312156-Pyramimonas_sp.AAC.1